MAINGNHNVGDSGATADDNLRDEAILLLQQQVSTIVAGSFPNATSSSPGAIQLAGDLSGGSAGLPIVSSTHLATPLPLAQGGTATNTQTWVDISTAQTGLAGNKSWTGNHSFSGTVVIDAPTNDNEAASKLYVDSVVEGKSYKDAARLATTAALATNTRTTNVLTASSNGVLGAIDGVTPALDDRILVKNETTGGNNGLYYVSSVGSGGTPWTLTRTVDADTSAEVLAGLTVLIEEGTANADSQYTLTTNNPITLNTTSLTFAKTLGAGSAPTSTGLIGNGSLTSIPYTHSLGTQFVDARVYDVATDVEVKCDVALTSSSVVTFAFGTAPATNSLRAVVKV